MIVVARTRAAGPRTGNGWHGLVPPLPLAISGLQQVKALEAAHVSNISMSNMIVLGLIRAHHQGDRAKPTPALRCELGQRGETLHATALRADAFMLLANEV